ncbi:hypothetical protein E2C01_085408 [Portunus trituberculatus]|uniref:Uncharacterized protein n=1 Tax=Portunus trituberculatus TaxID=210409 RepID=A0A5B7IXR8_PORTR|nr:hypothetical protein [Portunus trituberculatus]
MPYFVTAGRVVVYSQIAHAQKTHLNTLSQPHYITGHRFPMVPGGTGGTNSRTGSCPALLPKRQLGDTFQALHVTLSD